jgi:Ca2+/Na+ antiporter
VSVEGNLPRQVQLTTGEQILAQTRPILWNHLHLMVLAVLITIISPLPLIFNVLSILTLPLIIIALLLWLYVLFLYKTRYHLIVTNKRIIFFKKSLGIRLDDIHLEEVNDVKVDQGIIGRILNYGTVTVVRSKFTVMTSDDFDGIRDPFKVSGAMENAVASVKKE